jgi:hypothetical protein
MNHSPRTPRETAVNTKVHTGSMALLALLMAAPASAEQFGPLEISGFFKEEFSVCDNCSRGLANPSPFDPRGVLSPPTPMLNQGGDSGRTSSNLGLAMVTAGLTHEFDNAIKIEGRISARSRNNAADIFGHWVNDGYVGASHPRFGSLQVGKMTSRSWTRTDAFAYPVGLSSPWAESGAGYGIFPYAARYATPEYELPWGKIRFEATAARAKKRYPLNPSTTVTASPSPRLYEVFVQFSNEKNLIELIYQDSQGGRQSSFSKGAFYGAQGDTNGPAGSLGYKKPSESVLILEGNYWPNATWKLSYGIKRSEWSGQQQQCDFGPVSPIASACFWDQPGFNYAQDARLYKASEVDLMLGVSYVKQLWTFTLGTVRMNQASTNNPTEWGQDNSATFVNLGVYRKVPEVYKNLEAYAGVGRVMFGRQGPAPLSMPSNTAFGGVDPRTSESGNSITFGMNLKF